MSEIKSAKLSPRTDSGTVVLGDSGDTISIPAGVTIANSGTATGDWGGGKVVQFQYTQAHSPSVSVDGVTTYTSAGSSWLVSITPTATSSKIIIHYGSARSGVSGVSYEGRIKIYRKIGAGSFGEIETGLWQTTIKGVAYRPFSTTYVDSTHNTTSEVQYQLYVAASGNADISFADSSPCLRWISAMEIAA